MRREVLASFLEACHGVKHHGTTPDHRWFLGVIEDLVRALQP
jgi:hypothetical protein